uniref:Secreted protein n=1 Tax=Triticum urartu TaxID=4572 RepID=A0A8R7TP34_TRIUA
MFPLFLICSISYTCSALGSNDKIYSLTLKVQGGGSTNNALNRAAPLDFNPRMTSKKRTCPMWCYFPSVIFVGIAEKSSTPLNIFASKIKSMTPTNSPAEAPMNGRSSI